MLELKHTIRKKKIMLSLDGKTAIVTGCGSEGEGWGNGRAITCLLYTSPSPRDRTRSRMPSSA